MDPLVLGDDPVLPPLSRHRSRPLLLHNINDLCPFASYCAHLFPLSFLLLLPLLPPSPLLLISAYPYHTQEKRLTSLSSLLLSFRRRLLVPSSLSLSLPLSESEEGVRRRLETRWGDRDRVRDRLPPFRRRAFVRAGESGTNLLR